MRRVAQWVEHMAYNRVVAGSSPAPPILINGEWLMRMGLINSAVEQVFWRYGRAVEGLTDAERDVVANRIIVQLRGYTEFAERMRFVPHNESKGDGGNVAE